MWLKLFKRKSKLAFENLPTETALDILTSIVGDIEVIVKDERLRPILTKQALPKGATGDQINKMIIDTGAAKLTELSRYFLQSKRDNVLNILAALTVSDREAYGQKPLREMLADIKLIMRNSEIIHFFVSAGK